MDSKKCSECGEIKLIKEFYRRNSRPCGYQSRCKACADACHARYVKTEQGRESIHRTGTSESGRARMRKYDRSDKGREKQKRTRQTESYKEKHRKANAKYRCIHRQQIRAQNAVARAIERNKIPRANTLTCKECNKQADSYHHYLGYDEEHWLDIIPVCDLCHGKVNRRYE